jgi:3-oxoacyl-[acyl-carrier-protein] synthase-1
MAGVRDMIEPQFLGLGLHTHLGRGLAANLAALAAPPPRPAVLELSLCGQPQAIPFHPLADTPLDDLETRLAPVLDGVVAEALAGADLGPAERARTAVFVGSSSLDIGAAEARYGRELASGDSAYPLSRDSNVGCVAQGVRARFGLGGADYTLNTACTSSANALIHADAMLRQGRIGHALVLGVEVFNLITALGFQSLGLLAPDAMRPFDARRAGIVPGEGCSALLLGPDETRRGRFRLVGSGRVCDTFSISAANPDGSTVAEVMARALADAGLHAGDICAIKTHGTASQLNDESEAAGLNRLFPDPPPICALKPFIGHTFGACGLNELILFCAAAQAGFLPGTPGIAADPAELGVALTQGPSPLAPGRFLLNYFGFGGNNTALVIANDRP